MIPKELAAKAHLVADVSWTRAWLWMNHGQEMALTDGSAGVEISMRVEKMNGCGSATEKR